MCIEAPYGTFSKIIKTLHDNLLVHYLLCKDFASSFIVAQARSDYGF